MTHFIYNVPTEDVYAVVNDQAAKLQTAIGVVAAVIAVIVAGIICFRKPTLPGVIGGLLVGAAIWFVVGGGGILWAGNMFKDTLNTSQGESGWVHQIAQETPSQVGGESL